MFVNWKLREINLKIVYYGPPLSGKKTNLEFIYTQTNPALRGEIVSLKTHADRTLQFDFLQLGLGQVQGLWPKFNLYTAPGQEDDAASRKRVLQDTDGMVLVADSQASRLQDNLAALAALEQQFAELGRAWASFPLVVQLNKRDLANALPVEQLRQAFRWDDRPLFEAVAVQGVGVFETLKAVIHQVMAQVQAPA